MTPLNSKVLRLFFSFSSAKIVKIGPPTASTKAKGIHNIRYTIPNCSFEPDTYTDGSEKIVSFNELSQLVDETQENLVTIHSCEPTLEDIFIELTGGRLNV